MAAPDQDHWLVRPGTIRLLWIVFGVILTALVLADLVVQHHPLFGLDATFGFGAWYGFAGLRRAGAARQEPRHIPQAARHVLR